eukprot:Nk52_evm7s136 gene=Nk52_evmTU7s136
MTAEESKTSGSSNMAGWVDDFHWSATDEPHASRRKEILAKYPQIRDLYGPDIRTFPIVVGMVSVQVALTVIIAYYDMPWYVLLPVAYAIGGTITHSLSLAAHELSHNLCFETKKYNQMLAIFSSMPSGLPSAITFKKYHLDHHTFQGVDGIDVDIPTEWEARTFNTTLRKLFWVFCMPIAYAVRPLIIKPKAKCFAEIMNSVVCFSYDFFMWYNFGWKAIVYIVLSDWLGMGLHPCAGHFIAEHFVFKEGHETYSYYGPLNYITFFVGYHNEHHDFPYVAGTNLHKVREIAPEYYENLPSYDSWTKVLYDFITKDEITCFSRVKRSRRKNRAPASPKSE